MEQINIGITKEKKENLRIQIQILETEIKELKESGDKYGRLPEKQRYLDYLKQEWNKLYIALGKEYSSALIKSTEQRIKEIKDNEEVTFNDVTINEEWAMNNHYKKMHDLQNNIIKINNEINKEQDFVKKTNLESKKDKLEKELEILKKYSKSDIIMFAKSRKAAYLNAKKRYSKLSTIEKLKLKISGKEVTWDKIKDDNMNYTESMLNSMYQSRSK